MKKLLTSLCVFTLLLTGCGSKETKKEVSSTTGKETFTVGMECGYAPFNWQTNTQSDSSVSLGGAGYCDGYDVMIAREIAKALDKEIVIKKVAWDGLQASLNSGEIDAIIAGMTKDKEREKGVDFTTPYYKSDMVMIVRKGHKAEKFKDIQQFSGLSVLGQKSTNYDTVIDQIKGVKHAVPKTTYPMMVLALQNKEVDAITAETPVALGVIKANPDLVMVTFDKGKGFSVDPSVSIGMKKGTKDSDLFKAVQKAIDGIDDKKQTELMNKAVSIQPSTGK